MTAAATLAQLASSGALTADSSGNVTAGASITSSQSITIGTSGVYQAGSLYSDVNWGMIFRAKQASPVQAEFRFANAADTERMRIDTSGNLIVGSTATYNTNTRLYIANPVDGTLANPQCVLEGAASTYRIIMWLDGTAAYIGQNSNARALRMFSGSAGTSGVNLAVGGTSWGTFSDERIKTNLIPIENAIEKVSTLRTVTGRYTTDDESTSRVFLIAQDVQAVLPEAVDVGTDEDKTLFLKYTETIPLLVAAIKELKAELDVCKAEIAALKGV